MTELIKKIKNEVKSNGWANKKGAEFHYDIQKYQYRLIGITPVTAKCRKQTTTDRKLKSKPL